MNKALPRPVRRSGAAATPVHDRQMMNLSQHPSTAEIANQFYQCPVFVTTEVWQVFNLERSPQHTSNLLCCSKHPTGFAEAIFFSMSRYHLVGLRFNHDHAPALLIDIDGT